MRIQVNLSDKMVERVDKIAEDMGLSRSALCNMMIGQGVNSYEKAQIILSDVSKGAIERIVADNK